MLWCISLLLTHEARLEQNQSAKLLFTPNCGMMHSNYSQARRGGFGFSRYQGHLHSGNRNHNVGRGIFFNEYSGGFLLVVTVLAKVTLLQMQFHTRWSHARSPFNVSPGENSMTNADRSNEIILICRIYYKIGHTTDDCWHKYI